MKIIVGSKMFRMDGKPSLTGATPAEERENGEFAVELPPHANVTSVTFHDPFLVVQYWRLDN
jgi:hypothetical protein